MDYLLRTATESEMDDALEAAGILQEVDMGDGEMALLPVANAAVDYIGPIPPVMDEDGNVVKPGHPEFHANIRVAFELTEEQEAALPTFEPLPTVPYRVFA